MTDAGPSSLQPKPGGPDGREAALIAQAQAGDRTAWEALLTPQQDRLFTVCVRMVGRQAAADLCQSAMVKIVQGLGSYDGQSKLSTWMIRVTMNVCLSWLRSEKLRRHASLDAPLDHTKSEQLGETRAASLPGREPEAGHRVEVEEARRHLAAALSQLDPEQRAILILRDAQGLDYDRIALVLGIAVGTVKSRLFRARASLRELIESRAAERPGTGHDD